MKSANKIIKDYLYKEEVSVENLARQLKTSGQNLGKKLRAKNISILTVEEVSDALEHNFFEDLSHEWSRKHFSLQHILNEPTVKYGSIESLDKYIEKIIEKKVAEKLKK